MTMKRLKDEHLLNFDPITQSQKDAYDAWDDGSHMVLAGSAGTGKTFIGMYLGLETILDKDESSKETCYCKKCCTYKGYGISSWRYRRKDRHIHCSL